MFNRLDYLTVFRRREDLEGCMRCSSFRAFLLKQNLIALEFEPVSPLCWREWGHVYLSMVEPVPILQKGGQAGHLYRMQR